MHHGRTGPKATPPSVALLGRAGRGLIRGELRLQNKHLSFTSLLSSHSIPAIGSQAAGPEVHVGLGNRQSRFQPGAPFLWVHACIHVGVASPIPNSGLSVGEHGLTETLLVKGSSRGGEGTHQGGVSMRVDACRCRSMQSHLTSVPTSFPSRPDSSIEDDGKKTKPRSQVAARRISGAPRLFPRTSSVRASPAPTNLRSGKHLLARTSRGA